MSDLIERLREGAYELQDEAADAIEERDAEIAWLRKRVSDADECIDEQEREIERLREVHARDLAEYNRVAKDVTQLRAALERIERNLGMPADWYRNVAREVLNDA